MTLKNIFLSALVIGNCLIASAQQTMPPAIPGDFADPSIITDGKFYYAVGTSSEWAPHFPIYRSPDLQHWVQAGYVFDKAPDWTIGSFWAPEFYFMNGTYYIYYTARRKSDNISCIGVAVSDQPDRGFIDKGVIVDFGKEAIDAFITEADGDRFLSFKAYGLDKRPIELLAMKLSADGLRVEGEPFSLLKDEERIGLEGQSFIKKDDYYYLFYSAGNCCGLNCDYNVRVARSKNFRGPYERYEKNPILQEVADWKCTGHGSFVQDKNGAYQYLYHAYNKTSTVYGGRQGLLAGIYWPEKNGWPKFTPATGQTGSTTTKNTGTDIQEFFKENTVSLRWQWDWRHSSPTIRQSEGQLRLSGTVSPQNPSGMVLTIRPSTAVFTVQATVSEEGAGLRGLAYYGDAGSALGIGRTGNQIQIWITRDKEFRVISQQPIDSKNPIELKLSINELHQCRFYFKQGTANWNELRTSEPVSTEFLPQWDRSPRPGLHFRGSPEEYAIFTSFQLDQ